MSDISLPSGTLTFLFTDIEGSTRMLEKVGDAYVELLDLHNEILNHWISRYEGSLVKTEGDSYFAVFPAAIDAAQAAGDAQVALVSAQWPGDNALTVRMGLHTGTATHGGSDYVGIDVHRAARISDSAHGGQIVLSEQTAVLIERDLPDGMSLRDLGKHRLKDLSEPETIFQIVVEGLGGEFPPLRTLDAIPNNLPLQVTSFIGREDDLREALRLLEATRVLTLTGPGGTGKTRLSLQVAAESADQFDDGVFFVSLSPVSDPDVVPSTILSSLGLQASTKDQSPAARLLDQISGKNLLLVLDNFEQLLEAAPLVAGMVRASPHSRFLVTSRAPLHISGEQEMQVPPLDVVSGDKVGDLDSLAEVEAVQLFVERATSVQPGFEIVEDNAAAIAELVNRLDGLPLAIELVASRVRLLPVAAILDRLDSRMLSAGSVDLPERQQTITSAIDWSYDLLDAPQRRLFARLSVFAGDARLEEIETICGDHDELGVDLIDGLATLVDHSLMRASSGSSVPRFRMLHVIREYAQNRLEEHGESDEIHRRHLVAYTEMVEAAEPQLLKKDRKMWFDALEADHDNIRAALDWGMTREVDLVLRLSGASWRFWQARGHLHEARRRVESALAQPGGQPQNRATAMEALGGILWWQGEMDECLRVYTDTLGLRRQIGDPKELANALYNYSLSLAFFAKRPEEAEAALDEAEAIYTDLEDMDGLADLEWGRGQRWMSDEEYVEARDHMLKAAEYYRQAGNEFGLGWSLFEAGDMTRRMEDFTGSWPYFREGLEIFAAHHDLSAAVLFLAAAAGVAQALGDVPRSLRLAGAYHGFRISSGADIVVIDINQIEGLEYDTLESLDGDLAEPYREGKKMTFDQAVKYALAGPVDGG